MNWMTWLAISLVAGILEVALPSFAAIFACFAAAVTALVSLRFGLIPQLLSFSLLLILSMAVLRPRLRARLHRAPSIPSRSQNLLGKFGYVTEDLDVASGRGRVLVAGEDWAARAVAEMAVGGGVAGAEIQVESSDGIVLIVKAKEPE